MRIQFPKSTVPGTIPQEGDGRLVNCITEQLGEDIKYIRSPGIKHWGWANAATFRGMGFMPDGIVYAAFNNTLKKITPAGGAFSDVTASVLPGFDRVAFAANQNAIPDQVLTTENSGPFVFTSSTLAAGIPGAPFLNTASDVCFGSGYLFFVVGKLCYASNINSLVVQSTAVVTAEGKPDIIYRCIYFSDQLYLCGPDSIEIWGRPINPNPAAFPFFRTTVIARGILGTRAVTGFENGFDLGLVFASNNNQIMQLNGYIPQRISPPDLERLLENTADKSSIELSSFAAAGHMFIRVRAPQWCWTYDMTGKSWHENYSYLSPTSRTRSNALYVLGQWLVGDDTGYVGEYDDGTFTEYGQPLTWWLDAIPVNGFPNRVVVGPAHFEFVPGQGRIAPYVETITNIVLAAFPTPPVVTTKKPHYFKSGDIYYIKDVSGTTQVNGLTGIVGVVTPMTFTLLDQLGNPVNSTGWSAYSFGGTVTRQNTPDVQINPQAQITWSDDGGLNYRIPELRPLGKQGDANILIRLFLTGSIGPYGRIWRLMVSDPVYVSFLAADMPRINKRAVA